MTSACSTEQAFSSTAEDHFSLTGASEVLKVTDVGGRTGFYVDQLVFTFSYGAEVAYGGRGGYRKDPFALGSHEILVSAEQVN